MIMNSIVESVMGDFYTAGEKLLFERRNHFGTVSIDFTRKGLSVFNDDCCKNS